MSRRDRRLPGPPADALKAKDGLGNNGTTRQTGKQITRYGYHGDEGIAAGVLIDHYPFIKPLGPGGENVSLAQRLQHAGAHQPHNKGHV